MYSLILHIQVILTKLFHHQLSLSQNLLTIYIYPSPAHSDPAFIANLRATLSTNMSTQLMNMVATFQFQSHVLSLNGLGVSMNTLL